MEVISDVKVGERFNKQVKLLTVKVSIHNVTVPDGKFIIPEIERVLRSKSVKYQVVHSISRFVLHVICKDQPGFDLLVNSQDLTLYGQRVTPMPAFGDRKLIYVHGVPYCWYHAVVRDVLRPYGIIHNVEYFQIPGEKHDIVRRAIMTPTKDLPHAFIVDGIRITITYRGMVQRCFRCGNDDHKATDCPNSLPEGPRTRTNSVWSSATASTTTEVVTVANILSRQSAQRSTDGATSANYVINPVQLREAAEKMREGRIAAGLLDPNEPRTVTPNDPLYQAMYPSVSSSLENENDSRLIIDELSSAENEAYPDTVVGSADSLAVVAKDSPAVTPATSADNTESTNEQTPTQTQQFPIGYHPKDIAPEKVNVPFLTAKFNKAADGVAPLKLFPRRNSDSSLLADFSAFVTSPTKDKAHSRPARSVATTRGAGSHKRTSSGTTRAQSQSNPKRKRGKVNLNRIDAAAADVTMLQIGGKPPRHRSSSPPADAEVRSQTQRSIFSPSSSEESDPGALQ